MPIRIYSLAKELDIDSKELVDACTKAGVTDKGSALASLSDDEVAKVRAHLNKAAAPATSTGASAGVGAPAAMVRPAPRCTWDRCISCSTRPSTSAC